MDTKKSDLLLVSIFILITLIFAIIANTNIPRDAAITAVNKSLENSFSIIKEQN